MNRPVSKRIMMISTHGYVAATPELGLPDTGGQVVYVLEVAKALAERGYQVDLWTRQFDNQPATEPIAPGARVVRVPCGPAGFVVKEYLCDHIPEWCDNAVAFMRSSGLKYDLINTHYWDAGLAGCNLSRRLGIAHVHTPHSIGAWKRDNMPDYPDKEERYNFIRRVRDERFIYHDSDALVATTEQQRQILLNEEYDAPDTGLAVVPPGYDPARFSPVPADERSRLKQTLGIEGRVVLALGRLARNKGYDLLMRSMVPVFQRFADVKLLLAAGGSRLSDDEQYQLSMLKTLAADLKIEDRILWRDYIPDAQLPDYYRAADLFALSSRYEPFGMTAVEAMACGTPTIITTEGGLFEQVRYGVDAVYANPNDPEAFGHAMAAVLARPEIAESLSRHGARKALAKFTWSAVTGQLLDVFQRAQRRRERPAMLSARRGVGGVDIEPRKTHPEHAVRRRDPEVAA
jgi:mannosylfructose-phosphate synthase